MFCLIFRRQTQDYPRPVSYTHLDVYKRQVAGEIFMWKAGGARAALGGSLDEVIAAAQKAIDHTRSVGIGLTPCTLPAVGHPNFQIKDGTMEVGIGHHGEPGIEVCPLESAAQMARRMTDVYKRQRPCWPEADPVLPESPWNGHNHSKKTARSLIRKLSQSPHGIHPGGSSS